MIDGLTITPPLLGRISIGKVVERHGKRLPEKDDAFTVTSLVQGKDGWVPHPLDEALRKAAPERKLRAIAVRLLFADPDLNFRAQFTAFDRRTGRPVCTGNGQTCKRVGAEGLTALPCPGADACAFGEAFGCKPYGRLNVQIDGQDDDLGSFIFRTTGFNSIRTLTARLAYVKALVGDALPCLPLTLKLRAKSTTQSHRSAVYFVDLVVRDGMALEDALRQAREESARRRTAGWDQAALDAAATAGLAQGAFEDSVEEAPAVVEEFFSAEAGGDASASQSQSSSQSLPQSSLQLPPAPTSLREKLSAKALAGAEP